MGRIEELAHRQSMRRARATAEMGCPHYVTPGRLDERVDGAPEGAAPPCKTADTSGPGIPPGRVSAFRCIGTSFFPDLCGRGTVRSWILAARFKQSVLEDV